MKNIFALLIIIFSIPSYANPLNSKEIKTILQQLDEKILHQEDYRRAKEERIRMLHESLKKNTSKEERYHTVRSPNVMKSHKPLETNAYKQQR